MMRIKKFLRLFLPPFIYLLKDKILRKPKEEEAMVITEKEKLYNYTLTLAQRQTIKMQDVKKLSEDIPLDWIDLISTGYSETNYYGDFSTLLSYCDLDFMRLPPKKFSIQHGYVFDMFSWEKNKLNIINFVWSDAVKKLYLEYGASSNNIFTIGAPFFYSHPILNKIDIESEKRRLGKNLLAFPLHSTHFMDTNYNPNNFINILKGLKKQFDSIRICLYWKDIIRGMDKIYQENGFECVCCGHIFDMNFLRRQKTLFAIADATISNGVGSHIGYSVFMGKGHWLIPDEHKYVDLKWKEGEEHTKNQTKKNFIDVQNSFLDNENFIITTEQESIVDKFWGISEIKSPSEIRNLILEAYMRK